jgi:hypothetical protein
MNVFEAAPKRFERLHLHHPMPTSGRNPHRPLFYFSLVLDSKSLTRIHLMRSINDSFLTSFARGSIDIDHRGCV